MPASTPNTASSACPPLRRSGAAYESYLSLFEQSMAKAGVDDALRHRLHRMLADLKPHIVSDHMQGISEGDEGDSLLHGDLSDSLSQLQARLVFQKVLNVARQF